MEKKLYRSRENKVISGVCGGIAEYFNVDATLIRLLWAVAVLLGGTGIIAYILCIIIIPEAPAKRADQETVILEESEDGETTDIAESGEKHEGTHWIGFAFIAVGVFFFARRLFWWLNIDFVWELFWPAILVVFGLYLILRKRG